MSLKRRHFLAGLFGLPFLRRQDLLTRPPFGAAVQAFTARRQAQMWPGGTVRYFVLDYDGESSDGLDPFRSLLDGLDGLDGPAQKVSSWQDLLSALPPKGQGRETVILMKGAHSHGVL